MTRCISGIAEPFILLLCLTFFGCELSGPGEQPTLTLLGHRPFPGESISDVWGYVDPATGTEYALVGSLSAPFGLHIVDVSDPATPALVASVENVPGFDVKTWDHYAYTVTGGGDGAGPARGRIIDLEDPANPVVVGAFPSSHNVFIDEEGIMYLEVPGLRLFDLKPDPTHPILLWSGGVEGHDASVIGDRLYDFHGRSGTNIYDVSDPSSPLLLGFIDDPSIRYSHSGWVSRDGRYLFICDELSQAPSPDITVWDIGDVSNPERVAAISDTTSTVHNLYIIDDYAYASYYSAGLKVFDVSDPTQPVLTSEYDTAPTREGEGFSGAWGVYPFTPSGHLYVSDRQEGLYVFSFSAL